MNCTLEPAVVSRSKEREGIVIHQRVLAVEIVGHDIDLQS
jgi:hypothetical protein